MRALNSIFIAVIAFALSLPATIVRSDDENAPVPEVARILKAARDSNDRKGVKFSQNFHRAENQNWQMHATIAPVNLLWSTSCEPAYFHDERIDAVRHTLSPRHPGSIRLLGKAVGSEIALWKGDERIATKAIVLDKQRFQEPNAHGDANSLCFSISITEVFGALTPGRYRVHLRVRGDALRLNGKALHSGWVASPVVVFDVIRFEGRELAREKRSDVRLEILGPRLDRRQQESLLAVVVNDSARPIKFYGSTNGATYDATSVAPADAYTLTLRPHGVWRDLTVPCRCGTGKGYTTVPPGGRQPIALHLDRSIEIGVTGVQRFELRYQFTDVKEYEAGTALTPPFRLHGNRIAIFE